MSSLDSVEKVHAALVELAMHGITLESFLAMDKRIDEWRSLAVSAADEAAGWYDESRGGDRADLPAVAAVDRAIAEGK